MSVRSAESAQEPKSYADGNSVIKAQNSHSENAVCYWGGNRVYHNSRNKRQ